MKTEVKVETVVQHVQIETEEVVVTGDNQERLATETQDKIPVFKDPTFVVSIHLVYSLLAGGGGGEMIIK